MTKINLGKTSLTLNTTEISKDFIEADLGNRKKAARHVTKAMRRNIGSYGESLPGDFPGKITGDLQRKVGFQAKSPMDPFTTIVGNKSSKVHLLEFGHGDGKTNNKRPHFQKTFDEENAEVRNIMAEKWDK